MPTITCPPAAGAAAITNPHRLAAVYQMRRMVSERQREIWALLASGLTMKEAAARLELREQTVASVAKELHHKLGVRNAVGLALAGIAYGIVGPPEIRSD